MAYRFCCFFAMMLLPFLAGAQGRVHGKVQCKKCDVADAVIVCNGKAYTVGANGKYTTDELPAGTYDFMLVLTGAETQHKKIEITKGNVVWNPGTELIKKELSEVTISDERKDFGHMYQVDGMMITAGKKTEVIDVTQLNVNKSTNNTRQVYAKVAGLNIFENDGSGLQLSIGGRGLDPNRTANFNVRQNGYDISADPMGYPESYYTPPADALSRIEIIKGAASLQYGTQFGGLLNFEMRQPGGDKKLSVESKQTVGSWNFFGSYNAISGKAGKLSYYAYAHYKRGDGWRKNSRFNSLNTYIDLHYDLTDKHMIGVEYTHLNYLAQQPGGLDDRMFEEDPRQTNRARNWFAVDWNLLDLEWKYTISSRTQIQTHLYGLMASRDAIGFRSNRPSQPDWGTQRDLLKGDFKNAAIETRVMHRYSLLGRPQVLLLGVRAYRGQSTQQQGYVNNGAGADFTFTNDESTQMLSDYTFPNTNYAFFGEQIIRITDKWSITPGFRAEYIRTEANGFYYDRVMDLRDSIVSEKQVGENKMLPRSFLIGGIGSSYQANENLEFYGNFSQNYRSITFGDIRVVNPSFEVSADIADEKGWSADLGFRGNVRNIFRWDANVFYLYYGNRIGEYYTVRNKTQVIRRRDNIGVAEIYGLEAFTELDVLKLWKNVSDKWRGTVYSNLALTNGTYTQSPIKNIEGNDVEYVPFINWKGGIQLGYKTFKVTGQISYLSDQYADATNAEEGGYSGVNGIVPAYTLMDITLGWERKWLSLQASVNNVADAAYFTRRATGYPGPGIIPGDGRSFYFTAGIKL